MEQTSLYISEVCRELGVTPRYLRRLESKGSVPRANRDALGRIYGPGDVALLKALGVGSRPRKLKRPEEALDA
jgi:DNA-binding transcriptional MerR regulator